MSYTMLPIDQVIAQLDRAILAVDETILGLQAQNFQILSRMMLRRAQMVRFSGQFRGDEAKAKSEEAKGEFQKFRGAIEANAQLSQTMQRRISQLSVRIALLRTHRTAAIRARAAAGSRGESAQPSSPNTAS